MTRLDTSDYGSAAGYQAAGAALDEHVASCGLCRSGTRCPDGDDTAEAEYRAFRSWRTDDPDASRSAFRRPR